MLLEVWGDDANYECVCDDGVRTGHGPQCCRAANATHGDNYLPPALASVSFDILEASVVSKAILDQVVPFWESIHTERGGSAFLMHTQESSHVPQTWNWGNDEQSLRLAVSLGLFCSYQVRASQGMHARHDVVGGP